MAIFLFVVHTAISFYHLLAVLFLKQLMMPLANRHHGISKKAPENGFSFGRAASPFFKVKYLTANADFFGEAPY
jgi:hypothetical protein